MLAVAESTDERRGHDPDDDRVDGMGFVPTAAKLMNASRWSSRSRLSRATGQVRVARAIVALPTKTRVREDLHGTVKGVPTRRRSLHDVR